MVHIQHESTILVPPAYLFEVSTHGTGRQVEQRRRGHPQSPLPRLQSLPDIAIVIPVFHKGELVAYSANTAHHLDIGAPTPRLNIDIREVYAEGMLFASAKLYEEGSRNEAQWKDGGAGVWHLHKPDARQRAGAVESDIVTDIR